MKIIRQSNFWCWWCLHSVAASLLLWSTVCSAQIPPTVTAVGTASYAERGVSRSDAEQLAREDAQFNAIQEYLVSADQSRINLLYTRKDAVMKEINTILLAPSYRNPEVDRGARSVSVALKAKINVTRLNFILFPDGQSVEAIAFIFVAREKNPNAEGGYSLSTTYEVNSALSNVFVNSGLEVADAAFLEAESGGLISVDTFKQDFIRGDINGITLSSAAQSLQDMGIQYFAIGMLDINGYRKDSVTGSTVASVTVTARVVSLKGGRASQYASPEPVVEAQKGVGKPEARVTALKVAARSMATQLVGQINSQKALYGR